MSDKLVELKTDNDFIIDLMYAATENMLQTDIYSEVGLGNRCFMHPDMLEALNKLRATLKEHNLKLKIKDAYRPPLAHEKMLQIIPMEGFFARTPERSQHCHGSAIDCILVNREDDEELAYPCRVDAYEKRYAEQIAQGKWDDFKKHLEHAKYTWTSSPEAEIKNREFQRKLLEQVGLEALEHEWWHFNLPHKEKYPLVDFRNENGKFIFL